MARDIDAVIIATPDHTHFAAAMAAMELGKHVFVEKPLTHNIWQSRTLKKAAKYYGVVSQMGNQGHTTDGIRSVKEWYDAGILGQVREVIAWQPGFDKSKGGAFVPSTSFPPADSPFQKSLTGIYGRDRLPNDHTIKFMYPETGEDFIIMGMGN